MPHLDRLVVMGAGALEHVLKWPWPQLWSLLAFGGWTIAALWIFGVTTKPPTPV